MTMLDTPLIPFPACTPERETFDNLRGRFPALPAADLMEIIDAMVGPGSVIAERIGQLERLEDELEEARSTIHGLKDDVAGADRELDKLTAQLDKLTAQLDKVRQAVA